MKPIERVKKIINFYEISISAFEKSSGLSNNSIQTAIKRKSNLKDETLNSILKKYPQINPTWLLTGKGSMLLDNKDENIAGEPAEVYKKMPLVSDKPGVPYYDVDFIGGFDVVLNDQTTKPNFYIDYEPFNREADCWVNVSGDSMKPVISQGDIVALKKFETWHEFILYGQIYAVVTDDFRTIKIVSMGKDREHFSLIPYNKSSEFVKQDIPKRLIRHMFKVKGSIKKFF